MARRNREPLVNAWQLACCAIALPIVYCFEQQFYEAVVILCLLVRNLLGEGFQWFLKFPQATLDFANQAHASVLVTFGAFLLMLVGVVVGVIVGLGVVAIGIILAIPALVCMWLATTPGPVRYLLDLVLVFFVGLLLYGLIFPVLWRLVQPLIAMTLGEITFQRIRARVYGERPRFAHPAYLLVALCSFGFAGVRVFVPVAERGAQAWRAQVKEVFFQPTPTPNPWPMRFSVPPKTTIRTGVVVTDKNFEFVVHSDRHVLVSIGNGRASGWTLVRGRAPAADGVRLAFALKGEIVLQGGDEPATAQIWQPAYAGHIWLRPGETYRTNAWLQPDQSFQYCGGLHISYRTLSQGRASSWQDLGECETCNPSCDYCRWAVYSPVAAGIVEFKARAVTCLKVANTVIPNPTEYFFKVPRQRVVDTKIAVRRGDRVRVSVGSEEALYWVTTRTGEVVIPAQRYREETVATAGTVRLKGGLLDSGATVTVLARGPEWK